MNKEKLQQYIQSVFWIADEKIQPILQDYVSFSFIKNKVFINENKVNRQSYFLESGYVRSFVFDSNGNEVTTNIYSPPCFVNDFISFFKKRPTKENFQALTDCYGWTLSIDNVENKFHNIPEFREFGRLLVLNQYELLKDRMLEMIKDTAESRYLNLLSKHPDIFQNVSLKIIASYLGITDTSLSRIRKMMLRK